MISATGTHQKIVKTNVQLFFLKHTLRKGCIDSSQSLDHTLETMCVLLLLYAQAPKE